MDVDGNTHEQKETPSSPSFRVWLCGPFRVERLVGWQAAVPIYEVVKSADWSGSNCPRLLLKALLSLPRRQARREALLEMLWPDVDPESAVQNFHIATTKLRKVLQRPTGQGSLLLTGENTIWYHLEGQDLIWVDVDAALAALDASEHAEGVLCLLEQTEKYLGRGGLLEEEEGSWATTRRATIDRARKRSRLLLASAYRQEKHLGKAEAVLNLLLEEDPTDEDVVCRLMELFHQQRMTHQALRLYKQTCQMLEEEGLEPTAALKDLAECFRSEKQGPVLSQPDPFEEGSPTPQEAREAQRELHDHRSTGESIPFSPFLLSQTVKRGIIEAVRELGETPNQGKTEGVLSCSQDTCPFLNQAERRGFSNSEALAEVPPLSGIRVSSLLQYECEQANGWISSGVLSNLDNLRRKILQQLLTSTNTLIVVPCEELLNIDAWDRLTLALKDPSRTDSATLTHLEQLTNTYWDLYRSTIVKTDLLSSVSGHLVTITQLLRTSQPLSIQSRLCCAASNTCQIIGEIYFDMNNVATAEVYYTLAIEAAHEVGNDPLEALALGKFGVLSVYREAYSDSLPILQRAYSLAENTTTGKTKSWLKWKEAEALSGLQKKDDCIAAISEAEEVFDQDGFSSTGEDRHCTGPLIGYKGIFYAGLHLPDAQPLLHSALQQLPSGQARRRKAQILTHLALTYVWQKEVEEACKVASQALLYAAQTKSSWAVNTLQNFQKEVREWKDVYYVKKFNKQLNSVKGL